MKTKSFAMLAMTGLVAASIAYVAPALADDSSSTGSAMQAPADGSQNNATNNIGADNMGGASNQTDSNNNANSNAGSSSSSDDSSSPDQATGDEDY